MCPISGMVQFLIVIVTLLLVCHAVVVNMLKISFTPNNITLSMSDSHLISYEIQDLGTVPGKDLYKFKFCLITIIVLT